jgi:cellulase/cellobiase CelA1
MVSQWSGGFQANVTVRNNGSSTINGWTVRWTFANGQTVTNLWNGTLTATGSNITVGNASYNGTIGGNGTTTFGLLGSGAGATSTPANLSCVST